MELGRDYVKLFCCRNLIPYPNFHRNTVTFPFSPSENHSRIMSSQTFREMMEDCKEWERFFSILEPEVDVFAHELLRRVKARRSSVFPQQDPSEWFKDKTVALIKAIL